MVNVEIEQLNANDIADQAYNVGVWLAGYEERSRWLVDSRFWPCSLKEDRTLRVELVEDRDALSAPHTRNKAPGRLFNGKAGKRNWDGYWRKCWHDVLKSRLNEKLSGVDVFIDISSMPRAIYGALLIEAYRRSDLVNSITFAYVPGQHGEGIDGARQLDGLRPLTGLEGQSNHDGETALILGLGFDGSLAEAVVDLLQLDHYSLFYGASPDKPEYTDRTEETNRWLLQLAELVEATPVGDIGGTVSAISRLCDWYSTSHDVMIVPLGPKTHIVASIIVSLLRPAIGFRSLRTSVTRPVQVTVSDDTVPMINRVSFGRKLTCDTREKTTTQIVKADSRRVRETSSIRSNRRRRR